MLLQSMTRQASVELLARTKFGRLACANEGQPYVTPFAFVYDSDWLYSFSTVGQKITWMRANPLVCVEVDEIFSRQNWASVIVFGRYEELLDTPAHSALRERAMNNPPRKIVVGLEGSDNEDCAPAGAAKAFSLSGSQTI